MRVDTPPDGVKYQGPPRRRVRELEDTYFRRLTRTDDQLRASLDAYDARLAVG
jgi:hypothetical protein